jgi:HEAT repeat protein
VEAYIAALDDADSRVRRQAAAAVELLGDRRAVAPLLAKLHDEDAQVRGNVARALGRLCDKRAIKPLIALLQDPCEQVRSYALGALSRLNALAKLRDPQAMDALIAALRGSRVLRNDAVRALAEIGDPRAVGPLVEALTVEVRGVPRGRHWGDTIAVALGRIGEPAVLPLIDLLADDDTEIRRLAAEGLLYTRDRRAVEPLKQALQDEDPMVRHAAARALAVL